MKKILASVLTLSFLLLLGGTFASPAVNSNIVWAACDENSDETCDENLPPSKANIKLENPFRGGDNIFDFLKSVLNDILMPLAGVLAVLAFIYSGFLYVTAQGNETKLQTANRALLYTAIGTAILLGAWVISQVISNTISQLQ
ncbi:MAG: pilin [bacterium]